jgi:hypothetical protein
MSKRFNLYVSREYVADGKSKKTYHSVGVAWLNELPNGQQTISLNIIPGISITGPDVVAFEPRPRAEADADTDDSELPRGAR